MVRRVGLKLFLPALVYLQTRYPGFELCESPGTFLVTFTIIFKPGDRTTEFKAFQFCVTFSHVNDLS